MRNLPLAGHLDEIETEFSRIKRLVEDPESGLTAAGKGGSSAGGLRDISPEDILQAEKALGRMRDRWPNVPRVGRRCVDFCQSRIGPVTCPVPLPLQILFRLALVVLYLISIAGAILGTYYIM